MSTDRAIDDDNKVQMEYYSAIKGIKNIICSNMNGPRNYHTKWSNSERERQIPYDITYM